jgi:hypothetical protein
MSRRLFIAAAVAPCGALLSAQSFNLDFGEPTAPFCPNPPGNTWNISNAVSAVWIP